MVSEELGFLANMNLVNVLILILLEDGFGGNQVITNKKPYNVLILILLEDGFGEIKLKNFTKMYYVLILILLEDGFGEWKRIKIRRRLRGLNPYFVGRWFRSP